MRRTVNLRPTRLVRRQHPPRLRLQHARRRGPVRALCATDTTFELDSLDGEAEVSLVEALMSHLEENEGSSAHGGQAWIYGYRRHVRE